MFTLNYSERRTEWYRGDRYTIRVFQSSRYSFRGHQRVVTASLLGHDGSVKDRRYLSESILPWRDADPISRENHIELVEQEVKSLIDEQFDHLSPTGETA